VSVDKTGTSLVGDKTRNDREKEISRPVISKVIDPYNTIAWVVLLCF